MLLGIGFCFTGLWVSYTVRLVSGASIVMVAVGAYALVSLVWLKPVVGQPVKPEIDKTAGKRLMLQKQAILDVLSARTDADR